MREDTLLSWAVRSADLFRVKIGMEVGVEGEGDFLIWVYTDITNWMSLLTDRFNSVFHNFCFHLGLLLAT